MRVVTVAGSRCVCAQGCYKHTFYNITSYQCMETTPSLACANKCVFCWRHHKNPVGKVRDPTSPPWS
jgi:wyosine [tRNA(Phe)-imidazoG37] synthetase (radical SAM superfamily)